jgi:hypothetical protein
MRSVFPLAVSSLSFFLLVGCNRSEPKTLSTPPASARPATGGSTSRFTNESQFIVETILGRMAEVVAYAKTKQPSVTQRSPIQASERAGSEMGSPVYDVEIQLSKGSPLNLVLAITNAIWTPETYRPAADVLLKRNGLSGSGRAAANSSAGNSLASRLAAWSARAVEFENQRVSAALENDALNPVLHEQAALVLGVFGLREHSGDFSDRRWALCRVTAHLALAQALSGDVPASTDGRLAEAILFLLMNNQADALAKLAALPADPELVDWGRSLKARCTHDYRELAKTKDRSLLEKVALFEAQSESLNTDMAWEQLDEKEALACPDYVRIAAASDYSVQIGHVIARAGLPLEIQEASAVCELAQGSKLERAHFVSELNVLPGPFAVRAKDKTRVHVIDWGLWAGELQRQICQTCWQGYNFMKNKWGVPDEAVKFASECDKEIGDLRLFPFVRRLTCSTATQYRQAVDDGLEVTSSLPQLVSPTCWDHLLYKVSFTSFYAPHGTAGVNEWFKHNPPPGTAFDLKGRLVQQSLAEQKDLLSRLEKLHALAPYDLGLCAELAHRKFGDEPTGDQLQEAYQPLLDYAVKAITRVAYASTNNPAQFEKLLARAGELEPGRYFDLGHFYAERGEEEKAAEYYKKGVWFCRNDVLVANNAGWLVQYYFRKGQVSEADKLADRAAEVYSAGGLEAKIDLLFSENRYSESFEYLLKLDERYHKPGQVIGWCQAYKNKTGDMKYEGEVKKRLGTLFPKGMKKVSVSEMTGPPDGGVRFGQENAALQAAQISKSHIVVAVNGYRVYDTFQYDYVRDLNPEPKMTFVVWDGANYVERTASPPNHRFGVPIQTYYPPRTMEGK